MRIRGQRMLLRRGRRARRVSRQVGALLVGQLRCCSVADTNRWWWRSMWRTRKSALWSNGAMTRATGTARPGTHTGALCPNMLTGPFAPTWVSTRRQHLGTHVVISVTRCNGTSVLSCLPL